MVTPHDPNTPSHTPRLATVDDADEVARLLHDFNLEFDAPSSGASVLAPRLRALLATDTTFAILAGDPAIAVALVTLRANVWYAGPVALLDELYVVPELRDQGIGSAIMQLLVDTVRARGGELIEINVDEDDRDTRRFYERHGFTMLDALTGAPAFSYTRALNRELTR